MDAIEQALEVLGLGPDATRQDIKLAYRDLVMVWHPDRFPNNSSVQQKAEEKLKKINQAYLTLQNYNPASRARSRPHRSPSASSGASQNQQNGHRTASPPFEASGGKSPASPAPESKSSLLRWVYIIGAMLATLLVGYFMAAPGTEQDPRPSTLTSTPSTPSPKQPGSAPSAIEKSRNPTSPSIAPLPFGANQEGFTLPPDGHLLAPSDVISAPRSLSFEEPRRSAPDSFTIGSTKDEVLSVQGTPTEFNDRVWKYGLTSVVFTNGRVTNWFISPLDSVKARMLPSAPVETQRAYFTIGSTKDEVLSVQGTPTEFNDRVWKYGLTSVVFTNGRVTNWFISPLDSVKARMLPSAPVETQRAYFTIGSTKDEVLSVQGTPTEFNDRVWKYGLTSVVFTNGRVTNWDISPLDSVKARMLPSAPVETQRAYFTIGSTKDEVLSVQGTPTEFNDRAWKYGLTSIVFSNGRVTNWFISPLDSVKARMLPSAPVETQRAYFTIGSTKDEVLSVQGTPTEFNDRVWKYGLTSIVFSNGRVTNWDASPLSPIRAKLEPTAR